MSRSRRKTPITGWTTSRSEKWFKALCNRKRRKAESMALATCVDNTPDIEDPAFGLYGPKDGKTWLGDSDPRWIRK